MDRMGALGLVVVLAAIAAYATMLFVLERFTYRTWMFDGGVALGIVLAGAGSIADGLGGSGTIALLIGVGWFPFSRRELRIRGSQRLNVQPGDRLPEMSLHATDGTEITDRDLVAHAPTLLVLYRGWWCPSHKTQLDELTAAFDRLSQAGLSVYAGSVDSPAESAPIQEHLGDKITVLCDVPTSLLDEIGVRDTRGAPWYDRLVFGAKKQDIAMPAAIVIDSSGTVVYSYRSTRIDDRPDPDSILAQL